jgi:hypothetical protein
MCDSIARFRRHLQRKRLEQIIFVDETHYSLNDHVVKTLVAPNEHGHVTVTISSHYAPRYDMIAFVSGIRTFPVVIYSPKDRTEETNSKGINTQMLCDHGCELILDRATIHNEEKIMESFNISGSFEIVDIRKMPTQAAKRLSPLDNGLFGLWKNRVREHDNVDESNVETIMSLEWDKISAEEIHGAYHHCALTRRTNVYYDCPQPHLHKHKY